MPLLTPSQSRRIPFSLRSLHFAAFVTLLMSSGTLGCGPFGYIGKVSQKTVDAFEKAQESDAETYAPYEYWAAKAYLDRARVMMTYSEYERAFDYGSRAQQLAEAATRKAERIKEQEANAAQKAPLARPEAQPAAPAQQEPAASPPSRGTSTASPPQQVPAPGPNPPAASPPPRPQSSSAPSTTTQKPAPGRNR